MTKRAEEKDLGYCLHCAGSGEGMYDGSVCYTCKGSGHERADVEDESADYADLEFYDAY